MKAIPIKDNVYWVGGIDWDLRNFHGYLTQRGSTYNAYLIVDEKITLIDTVKHYLFDEMLERISNVTDPAKIDLIVSNHVEMDHSGSLPKIKAVAKQARIVTSPNGEKGLKAHYGEAWDYQVVKTGDSVNLGKRTLQFVLTPMVHWPDNMHTYLPENNILFSNDAFGQHIASPERFDDEFDSNAVIMEEARKYYANIVLPYSSQVSKVLGEAGKLDIDVIAPSHGIIWRQYRKAVLERYQKWSANETADKALIIYDTMWGSTAKIAETLKSAFEDCGIRVRMCNLAANHRSDVMTDVIDARYICVGSPTLNNNMLPTVAGFLSYFKGLAPKDRRGLAFGSYGWGGQSIGEVNSALESCGFHLFEPVKFKYIPKPEALQELKTRMVQTIKNRE